MSKVSLIKRQVVNLVGWPPRRPRPPPAGAVVAGPGHESRLDQEIPMTCDQRLSSRTPRPERDGGLSRPREACREDAQVSPARLEAPRGRLGESRISKCPLSHRASPRLSHTIQVVDDSSCRREIRRLNDASGWTPPAATAAAAAAASAATARDSRRGGAGGSEHDSSAPAPLGCTDHYRDVRRTGILTVTRDLPAVAPV